MENKIELNSYSLALKLWNKLSQKRKNQLFLVFISNFLNAFSEIISLGAVLPFLYFLSSPEKYWKNTYIRNLAIFFNINSPDDLLLPITIAFGLIVVLASAIKIINLWLNSRLSAYIGNEISCESYYRTLKQEYEVNLKRNSSTLIAALSQEVQSTVVVINALLQFFTSLISCLAILTVLLIIQFKTALVIGSIFGILYGITIIKTRKLLKNCSVKINQGRKNIIKELQEGFGSLKDIVLENNQKLYLKKYKSIDNEVRKLVSLYYFLELSPRYFMESAGIFLIAIYSYFIIAQQGDIIGAIPLLGAFALGSQRLLPTLQQLFSTWSSIRGYKASVEEVIYLLDQEIADEPIIKNCSKICLKNNIRLSNLGFTFNQKEGYAIKGINIEIKRGQTIGIIGTTGSGKSTMVDIIMGLLKPTNGKILVDDIDINLPENRRELFKYRNSISHVPQSVFLSDNSIFENIAYGVPKDKIDYNLVYEVAKKARIYNFVESLNNKFETFVGERGVRLSGGQIQRIGIARALYKKSSIIVLDEATSALDTKTEQSVMENIYNLNENYTTIIIAHRLSSLKKCDTIFEISNGQILNN